jgi:hypothetical protein
MENEHSNNIEDFSDSMKIIKENNQILNTNNYDSTLDLQSN